MSPYCWSPMLCRGLPERLKCHLPWALLCLILTLLCMLADHVSLGIMSAFYLILFPAGFSVINPWHNKMTWVYIEYIIKWYEYILYILSRKVIYYLVSLSRKNNNKRATIYKTELNFITIISFMDILICLLKVIWPSVNH